MASEIPDLVALERTGTGKGAARQARREGYVPGIVYGGGHDPLPINLEYNALLTRLRAGRFLATLFNLKVEGHDDVRVICRDVQRDVVRDVPTHTDFIRLRRTTRINIYIPVEIIDHEQAPGLKRGGVLTLVRPEIELVCTAGDIPEKVVASIKGMQVGDTLTVSSVTLPEGTRAVIERDFVIANIQPPSGLVADDDDDIAADDVPATEVDGAEED